MAAGISWQKALNNNVTTWIARVALILLDVDLLVAAALLRLLDRKPGSAAE